MAAKLISPGAVEGPRDVVFHDGYIIRPIPGSKSPGPSSWGGAIAAPTPYLPLAFSSICYDLGVSASVLLHVLRL